MIDLNDRHIVIQVLIEIDDCPAFRGFAQDGMIQARDKLMSEIGYRHIGFCRFILTQFHALLKQITDLIGYGLIFGDLPAAEQFFGLRNAVFGLRVICIGKHSAVGDMFLLIVPGERAVF